tara:strand:+ start:225 stop:980 length:756 start_codon:yes stop_codon:yes gene_type:complete
MKNLIKQILREQNDIVPGIPEEMMYDQVQKKSAPMSIPTKTVFFKVVKQLLTDNPRGVMDSDGMSPEDRSAEMSEVLKLFGINPWYNALVNKIFWAAHDNQKGIEDGEVNSFNDLVFRPLKKYKVTCEENWTEAVWYHWVPEVEAYSEDDATQIVYADEDGYYQYWEWESEPGFSKDFGDTEGEGKEVVKVEEIGSVNESRIIKENESPDENELVDGLRHILAKQREAHSEDAWYNDITKLLNKLNIPLEG